MENADVIVAGAGVSGLAFACRAAAQGRRVLVLEATGSVGGCLHSRREPGGYWFELGAHTTYNSYSAFLDLATAVGAADKLVQRGPARAHFGLLRGGRYVWLTPPKVLLQLNWLEAALHFPFGVLRSKEGQSVRSYYSRLVGPRNYGRVLAPFFAAVPSQKADGLPVAGPGSLFKKRTRREEFPRSYGFHGGLQTVADAAARFEGVHVRTGVEGMRVDADGSGFAVTDTCGRTYRAPVAAVAASPDQAARMLADGFPALAREIGRIRTVEVESAGTVLPRERCWMPECAFVVPVDDVFFSCVTRDPFPDPERRAFAFHFRPGLSMEEKRTKMSAVLRVPPEALGEVSEWRHVLPAPAVGHGAIVAAIDRELAGKRVALTGNYFGGLAIEDCVLRSNAEWDRVSAAH